MTENNIDRQRKNRRLRRRRNHSVEAIVDTVLYLPRLAIGVVETVISALCTGVKSTLSFCWRHKWVPTVVLVLLGVVWCLFGPVYYGTPVYFGNKMSYSNYRVANGVESIPASMFEDCDSIESIKLSDSVTTIELRAFSNCTSLREVELSDSLTSIGAYAFENCESLENIELPDSVTTIENFAFWGCELLSQIEWSNSLTSIGEAAFRDCILLKNIKLPNSVTTIADQAFSGCESLESIKLSKGLTRIEHSTFLHCRSLKSIKVPNGITTIEDDAFYGCKSLESIELSDSVTTIGEYAFYGCESLKSVELPDSVTTIGVDAFEGCPLLEIENESVVDIPDNAIDIPDNAIEYNGHYYMMYSSNECGVNSWTEAKDYCENMGGHLATITSKEENDAMITLLPIPDSYEHVAIGASDSAYEGEWKWVTGESFDYTNWGEGEPNNDYDGRENYLQLYEDGTWNDMMEDALSYFICEWDEN